MTVTDQGKQEDTRARVTSAGHFGVSKCETAVAWISVIKMDMASQSRDYITTRVLLLSPKNGIFVVRPQIAVRDTSFYAHFLNPRDVMSNLTAGGGGTPFDPPRRKGPNQKLLNFENIGAMCARGWHGTVASKMHCKCDAGGQRGVGEVSES